MAVGFSRFREAVRPRRLMVRMPLMMLAMRAQDHFHSILERELTFLEGNFFDLLGFGEVVFGGELLESIF